MSDGRFAATASEEAEKINAQAGPGPFGMELVTDQEFWERQGIRTGEELALSVLSQEYSDLHKEIHGVRPRHERHTSVDDVQDAINKLESHYSQDLDDGETIKVSDVEPDDEIDDFESLPQQTGMGRRMENKKMSITKSDLIAMVREEIENIKNEGKVDNQVTEAMKIPDTVQTPYELLNYFEKRLSTHDWGHEYSDDPRVSRSGREQESHLNHIQGLLKQFGLEEPAQQAYDRYEREAREGRAPGDLPKFFFEGSDDESV